MSEHTPLTEAERERVTWVLGDLLRYYAERRSMANPKGWDHVRRQFETAAESHYRLREAQAAEVRSVLTGLAARTSTATAERRLVRRGNCTCGEVTPENHLGHADGCRYFADSVYEQVSSTATADTGLRERVEALADWCEREEAELVIWYGHEQCVSHNAAMKLRDLLDTPASTEDACNEGTR